LTFFAFLLQIASDGFMGAISDRIVGALGDDFFTTGAGGAAATPQTKLGQIQKAEVSVEGDKIKIKMEEAGAAVSKELTGKQIGELKGEILERLPEGDDKTMLKNILDGGNQQQKAQVLEAFMKFGPKALGAGDDKANLAKLLKEAANQKPGDFSAFLRVKADEFNPPHRLGIDLDGTIPDSGVDGEESLGLEVVDGEGQPDPITGEEDIPDVEIDNQNTETPDVTATGDTGKVEGEGVFGTRTTNSIPTFNGVTVSLRDVESVKAQREVAKAIAEQTEHSEEEINKIMEDAINRQLPKGPQRARARARKFILAEFQSIRGIKDGEERDKAMKFLRDNLEEVISHGVTTSIICKDNRVQVYCCPPQQDHTLKIYKIPEELQNNANASRGIADVHQILQRGNIDINPGTREAVERALREYVERGIEIPDDPLVFSAQIFALIKEKDQKLFAKIKIPENLLVFIPEDSSKGGTTLKEAIIALADSIKKPDQTEDPNELGQTAEKTPPPPPTESPATEPAAAEPPEAPAEAEPAAEPAEAEPPEAEPPPAPGGPSPGP
jgi:CRISPR/Cas system-associated exonuclease Cas4 (RecB family)